MLDHSTILFGSNMSNSDKHNNDPLPAAILGHAHGRIKGGQHVKYPQDSRFADLLVTLFDRNNIPVENRSATAAASLGGLDMRRVRRQADGTSDSSWSVAAGGHRAF